MIVFIDFDIGFKIRTPAKTEHPIKERAGVVGTRYF